MPYEEVSVPTADGDCPVHVLTPEGQGPWPAVIIYMDAFGVRPVLDDFARRLAGNGYVVLLPDMFYRAASRRIPSPSEVFAAGNIREALGPLIATTGVDKAVADTQYLLDYIDTRQDVKGKVGAVGFCMGGGMAIAAAGTHPDRIAAAVSFHGGRLATDEPGSPHLLAPRIKAEIYVAGADEDSSYPPEMHEQLKRAFDEASVNYRAEIYAGALHGWMKPDFPVYDQAAAERGWAEMLAVFGRALR